MLKVLICAFLSLITAVPTFASAWADVLQIDAHQSSVFFLGKSTIHNFEGRAPGIEGQITLNNHRLLGHGRLYIKVLSLSTANPNRDANMRTMFSANQFPLISFDIQKADFSNAHEGKVFFEGMLNMHGVSRPLRVASDISMDGADYVCRGKFDVSLSHFNLKAPTAFGFIRVDDSVLVQFYITFRTHS